MPSKLQKLIFSSAVFAVALAGCLPSRRGEYHVAQAVSVDEPSDEADRFWLTIQDTLRRHDFTLDRVDRPSGVISTLPEGSQHYFEFWRRDVNTREDFWEATLNPLRRRAEVTVTRSDDGRWSEVSVAVYKQRLSAPDRQFNSTGAAYQYFGESLPSTTGAASVTAAQDRWIDQGRDPAMEELLLHEILRDAPDAATP